MDINDLPNIVLESAVAKEVDVAANGLRRMADEGTLPMPFARRGTKLVWREKDIQEFFGVLQSQQSAYDSFDPKWGQAELNDFSAFVCPSAASVGIGNRRPSHLALFTSGSPRNSAGHLEVEVYPVLWVQTQKGIAGETLVLPEGADPASVTEIPWDQIRPGVRYPMTLFKLDTKARQTLQIASGIRRGGTISTESLMAALATPGAVARFKGGTVHF